MADLKLTLDFKNDEVKVNQKNTKSIGYSKKVILPTEEELNLTSSKLSEFDNVSSLVVTALPKPEPRCQKLPDATTLPEPPRGTRSTLNHPSRVGDFT